MSPPDDLTSDNLQLSRATNDRPDSWITLDCTDQPLPLTIADGGSEQNAINCKNLEARIAELVRASLAPNTRLAYAADLAAFRVWGGTLPASLDLVASYLADHADLLSSATLVRRLAALARAHNSARHSNPVALDLVRSVMRGIRRMRARPQKAAKALRRDQLQAAVNAMDQTLRDTRDRALLLIGFAGALRRSELVGLDVADLEKAPQGLVIYLRQSKTAPYAQGRTISVAVGEGRGTHLDPAETIWNYQKQKPPESLSNYCKFSWL